MPNEYGEIWGKYGSENVFDICFQYKGEYVDITSECGGTWVVRYANVPYAGSGFKSRLEAFIWAQKEIGFKKSWMDIIREELEQVRDTDDYGIEFTDYLNQFMKY